MSLVALIAAADERGLATTGLACLDRCLPLLGGGDETLRPLWSSLADGHGWPERLAAARAVLDTSDGGSSQAPGAAQGAAPVAEGRALVLRMLDTAPADLPPVPAPIGSGAGAQDEALHSWADACSLAALRVHALLDGSGGDPAPVAAYREGRTQGITPLAAAELRRQSEILTLLAEHGAGALRQALETSTEGRRILRAAVSRRTRVR
ncbi:hypothetical protein GCM10018793_26900 [Streptomyces sulfonofaciens]|uniref:Uncharacterized protein n=1 Tax=Streptomyces sulfonofaciens TaxID=68272 RepID=A0A919G4F1_9ACTN|nr:hypothetical protein [Streptomyces sulfonofaciens]GHH77840.1 hypothetical protein GCM10018793_26900 [Streptomyces sulfonofaciens]